MIRFYNTLTRKKDEFRSIVPGKVGMYCCGPTVYHYAHIGNLRAYIFQDVLRRALETRQFEINHVMNITDVGHLSSDSDEGEDKMLKGAAREGKTVWEIADFYDKAFFRDTARLNILLPTKVCKATEHINEMIELIKRIEQNGFTYESGGNIYFDISKFEHYAELARLNISEQQAGARINIDEQKRNPYDFVLWFTNSKFGNQEMQWDSPWGRGFPGWHVECSAMSIKYLGEQFDIHCGGIDHIPIHHTNEIAQSEAATGKHPWVRFWLHNEFLVVDKGKMAKSGDNFLTLQKVIDEGFDPLVYRYFCLGAHYRQQLKFSWDGMEGAKNAFNRLKDKILELKDTTNGDVSTKQDTQETVSEKINEYLSEFDSAIDDDVNTPRALSVLWSVLRDESLTAKEKLDAAFGFDKILGLGMMSFKRASFDVPEEIKKIVSEREEARKAKDWSRSDELREKIKKAGFIVSDTPEGPNIDKV